MNKKILIMGLPGAGKTTLAKELSLLLNAALFNADAVRENINKDLGFSIEDRLEQATRMGWMCDRVAETGGHVIADFICPTPETREAFGDAFIIWVDRIDEGRFEDTNKLFVQPEKYDLRVTSKGEPRYWAEKALSLLQPTFNPQQPTALLVGRYQPFHDGHKKLIEEAILRTGQACIAVRNTHQTDPKNPLSYFDVKSRIEHGLKSYAGRFTIVQLPNITNIFYGRDVGYTIERIDLDEQAEAISATKIRQEVFEK